jgi:hypothetical protein
MTVALTVVRQTLTELLTSVILTLPQKRSAPSVGGSTRLLPSRGHLEGEVFLDLGPSNHRQRGHAVPTSNSAIPQRVLRTELGHISGG